MENTRMQCRDPIYQATYFTDRARVRDSKIDYFLTSENILGDIKTQFLIEENVGTDHHPGIMEIDVNLDLPEDILNIKYNFRKLLQPVF